MSLSPSFGSVGQHLVNSVHNSSKSFSVTDILEVPNFKKVCNNNYNPIPLPPDSNNQNSVNNYTVPSINDPSIGPHQFSKQNQNQTISNPNQQNFPNQLPYSASSTFNFSNLPNLANLSNLSNLYKQHSPSFGGAPNQNFHKGLLSTVNPTNSNQNQQSNNQQNYFGSNLSSNNSGTMDLYSAANAAANWYTNNANDPRMNSMSIAYFYEQVLIAYLSNSSMKFCLLTYTRLLIPIEFYYSY